MQPQVLDVALHFELNTAKPKPCADLTALSAHLGLSSSPIPLLHGPYFIIGISQVFHFLEVRHSGDVVGLLSPASRYGTVP